MVQKPVLFLFFLLFFSSTHAEVCSSVERHGITWFFDEPYECGRFANGDYWVLGPVSLVAISPGSRATVAGEVDENGREYPVGTIINGSMLNISPGYSHGYCSHVGGWDPALNVAWGVDASHLLDLPAGSSLVSTASRMPLGNDYSHVQRASVLTVLAEAPAEGSFRPPYAGSDKSVKYNVSQLDYSELSSLPPVASTPALSELESSFERLWLDHKASYTGRYTHPYDNMPNYGCGIAGDVERAGLLLNLEHDPDPVVNNSLKETLLIRFVQYGVDLWGVYQAGGTDIWVMDGGHGPGRKLPILFAGVLLGDQEMAEIGLHDIDDPFFGEDHVTYYLYREEVERWIGADGLYPSNNLLRDNPAAYYIEEDYADLDLTKMGVSIWALGHEYTQDGLVLNDGVYYSCKARHVSSSSTEPGSGPNWNGFWRALESHYLGIPEYGKWYQGGAPAGPYQGRWIASVANASYRTNWGWPIDGIVLTAHIMGLKAAWNHDALFDYQDRYVAWLGGQNAFIKNMWDAYRPLYGCTWDGSGERDCSNCLYYCEESLAACGGTELSCGAYPDCVACSPGELCCGNECVFPACTAGSGCQAGQTCSNQGTCYASCQNVQCAQGEISSLCYCGGSVRETGYCCSGLYQTEACPACETSNTGFQNFSMAGQAGVFAVEYDATPNNSGAGMDGLVGFSLEEQSSYDGVSVAVRFHNNGLIEARDGNDYDAVEAVSFSQGVSYHFRLLVDVANNTYDAYVTPQSDSEMTIASGYSFRDSAFDVEALDNWLIVSDFGSFEVCDLEVFAAEECVTLQLLAGAGGYVEQWKKGDLGMVSLLEKISRWKAGTGC